MKVVRKRGTTESEGDMGEWNSIDDFAKWACNNCTANDWYCPSECLFLMKARQYSVERINKRFDDCGEDAAKLALSIMQWK